jgi:hypothetical protein
MLRARTAPLLCSPQNSQPAIPSEYADEQERGEQRDGGLEADAFEVAASICPEPHHYWHIPAGQQVPDRRRAEHAEADPADPA